MEEENKVVCIPLMPSKVGRTRVYIQPYFAFFFSQAVTPRNGWTTGFVVKNVVLKSAPLDAGGGIYGEGQSSGYEDVIVESRG